MKTSRAKAGPFTSACFLSCRVCSSNLNLLLDFLLNLSSTVSSAHPGPSPNLTTFFDNLYLAIPIPFLSDNVSLIRSCSVRLRMSSNMSKCAPPSSEHDFTAGSNGAVEDANTGSHDNGTQSQLHHLPRPSTQPRGELDLRRIGGLFEGCYPRLQLSIPPYTDFPCSLGQLSQVQLYLSPPSSSPLPPLRNGIMSGWGLVRLESR